MLRDAHDGEVTVPATIQALLASRLDQLPPLEREVLECGAVEGRVFHLGAVQALAPEQAQLGAALASLVRKDLVRPDPEQLAGDEAYRFRHVLIRDAAYDALPKSGRADLHERLADWLETASGDVLEGDEVRGYHLEQAYLYRQELAPGVAGDEPVAARATNLLEAAGRRALARLDAGAARNLFERALALRPEADPAVTLRLDLAEVLFLSGDAAAATQAAADAAERARATGYEVGRLRAELMGARIAALAGDRGRERRAARPRGGGEARLRGGRRRHRADRGLGRQRRGAELVRCQYAAMLEAVEHAIEHASRAGYTRWERELPGLEGHRALLRADARRGGAALARSRVAPARDRASSAGRPRGDARPLRRGARAARCRRRRGRGARPDDLARRRRDGVLGKSRRSRAISKPPRPRRARVASSSRRSATPATARRLWRWPPSRSTPCGRLDEAARETRARGGAGRAGRPALARALAPGAREARGTRRPPRRSRGASRARRSALFAATDMVDDQAHAAASLADVLSAGRLGRRGRDRVRAARSSSSRARETWSQPSGHGPPWWKSPRPGVSIAQ